MEITSLALDWIAIHPLAQFIIGLLLLVTSRAFYDRITHGTGKFGLSLMILMAIAVFIVNPLVQLLALLVFLSGLFLTRERANELAEYRPAIVRMEGGGIKRGLSPAEASVLLGMPFHISLSVAILGMLQKGILKQIQHTPLKVELADSLQTRGKDLSLEARRDARRQAGQLMKIVIQPYEELLIEFLEDQQDGAVTDFHYGIILRPFVHSVVTRLGGYNLEETKQYYRLIIQRAPREARSEGELTVEKERVFDRNFGWILLNEDMQSIFDDGETSYTPRWIRASSDLRNGVDRSFAQWVTALMESMKATLPEEAFEFERLAESNTVAGRLFDDVLKATFFS